MTPLARHWPAMALLASAVLIGVAHAFESLGGLAPCMLCLKQREVYWAIVAMTALGLAWRSTGRRPDPTRLLNVLLTAAFLLECVIAVYHAGAEWKFWPGPAACSGGANRVDPAEMARLLSGAKLVMPSCDKPAWVFLWISMAGWNALIAAGLTAMSAWASIGGSPPRDVEGP